MRGPDPEVLVVGGGPAGSVTALLLARRGCHVRLVDRARFPRPKPCGECVNPGAVAALDRLGLLPLVEGLGPARLRQWRIRTPTSDVVGAFGGPVHALGIARSDLDAALLQAAREAGVQVQEGARVVGVQGPGSPGGRPSVELADAGLTTTVSPRIVVGADGLRSVVVRSLGLLRRRPRLRKVSVTAHVTGEGLPTDEGILHVAHGVTLGVAPLGRDRWNATVVAEAGGPVATLAADPAAFLMDRLRQRLPGARELTRLEGPWTSGPFDWPVGRAWAPGVVLVGDAAGYYDPFTGQGIYRALRSAELASRAVALALSGYSDALAEYSTRWRGERRWSGLVQRGVEAVMSRPALRDRALPVLGATGALNRIVRVTGDVGG